MTKLTHIIAPFQHATDGDWHAIDLYLQRQLIHQIADDDSAIEPTHNSAHQVFLWSTDQPNASLQAVYPIQEIKPYSGALPQHGALIICGAETKIGAWFNHAIFDCVTLIHNISAPQPLYKALQYLNAAKNPRTPAIQIVYTSNMIKEIAGLAGKVITAIPSLHRFKVKPPTPHLDNHTFTVGKIAIDNRSQHHHDDIALYQALANEETKISIAGGTCLPSELQPHQNITLLPSPVRAARADFYRSIDCYFARALKSVNDHYCYAVLEAMLSGLPVVCHQNTAISHMIKHGINGFIFQDNAQAFSIINQLKKDANLRQEVGMSAALSVNRQYSHRQ